MTTEMPQFVELTPTPKGMVLSFLLGSRCCEITLDESSFEDLAVPTRHTQIRLKGHHDRLINGHVAWLLRNTPESRVRDWMVFLLRELRDSLRLEGDLAFGDYEYHGHARTVSLQPLSREWYDARRDFATAWLQVAAYLDEEPTLVKERDGVLTYYSAG